MAGRDAHQALRSTFRRPEELDAQTGYCGAGYGQIAGTQVTRAGWPNLRAMVCGYDLVSVEDSVTTEVNHGD
jgi:hypothetical protein